MAKLPSYILKALRNNKTSLGEHPSFPPEEEENFIVSTVSRVFDEVIENFGNDADYETLKSELGRLITECRKLEKNNIQSLEELCGKIINDFFQIPNQTLKIEAKIVNKVNTDNERLVPEKTSDDFSFDDINDMNTLSDEIYKRRMLNVLVTGAAMHYMNIIGEYVKEVFDINSELPALYKKIIDINTVLMFYEEDRLDDKKTSDGGKVDVTITSKNNFPTIQAEAVVFPVLVEETIRGILELAVSHGLPKDIQKAKYILSKADFKLAEVWDMRLGYCLWNVIAREIEKCELDIREIGVNFFLMELSEMDCEEFNNSLQEIFAKTKKGREIISDIFEKISYNKDKDEFDDYIKTKNDSMVQINDNEFYSPQDLITDEEDEFFTPQDLITDEYEY